MIAELPRQPWPAVLSCSLVHGHVLLLMKVELVIFIANCLCCPQVLASGVVLPTEVSITLEDIGGLEEVKADLVRLSQLFHSCL